VPRTLLGLFPSVALVCKTGDALAFQIETPFTYPSHVAISVPRITNLPFYWRQYRIEIGLELHFE
jgi:hypothetical protein